MLKHLSAYILLLGLVCQIGHAQRSGGTFSILSESIGPLVAEGNTSTTGFSQIGASEAVQGTFATATTGFSGTTGFLSQQNSSPTDLNFTEPLTIVENQTIGTVVGEFNATDVDGGTITYSLASGGVDNHLFSISSSGVLSLAQSLDYENDISVSFRTLPGIALNTNPGFEDGLTVESWGRR